MRIVGNNPQLSRQTQATASGAITGGKPVIVNTDGTVTEIAGSATSVGTSVVFETGLTESLGMAATFDSNSNRIVIAYQDGGNSNYGTAIVGTIDSSDNSISFGTAVVYHSANSNYNTASFDSNSNKVVIAFTAPADGTGKSYVGTVDPSDNSISFGSAVNFQAGARASHVSSAFDSNSNKVAIFYEDNGNSNYGTGIVGPVSGTSISYGSEAVFESAQVSAISATFDSSNNKVVIAYRDHGNSNYGTAVIGTISSTSISFGTPVVFESAITTGCSATFDNNSNKVFIAYDDHGATTQNAIIGTVSGTSISFGTAVAYETGVSTGNLLATGFDSSTNKVVVGYGDAGDSNKGKISVGSISGTSVSFETPVEYDSGSTAPGYCEIPFDSNTNRLLLPYKDGNTDPAQAGAAVVIQTSATNLTTSENFIGFAQDTVATGQPVTINTKGAIDENQSSLTPAQQYFVQTDGTLGTSADDPSVVAGTAVTATKLIVKG